MNKRRVEKKHVVTDMDTKGLWKRKPPNPPTDTHIKNTHNKPVK